MRTALLVLTLLLAGCATVAPPPAGVDWQARLAQWQSLPAWRMTGRVALSVTEGGGSASVDWRQSGATTDVALAGPLGIGAVRAVLDEEGLRLEDSRGERLQGAPAAALLQARLGAPVPLDYLRYWLLGLPAPGERFHPLEPANGIGDAFVQAGWTVDIGRFGPAGAGELPLRLTVSRDDARLRLAVNHWDLAP